MRRLPRPTPRTPLQRALGHFALALGAAKTDRRTFHEFLAIVAVRIAREESEQLDREPRP